MKKHLLPIAASAIATMSVYASARQSDPVVMTINGKDVKQSEFVYLFNKNNLQQVAPQSIEEYVDMFVLYKLKVADAEAAGIDTTASFKNEFNGYCAELASPHMRDSVVEDRLIKEAYARMQKSRCVSHIMVPLGKTVAEKRVNREKLDSIRNAILHGADFGELAVKYSYDGSAARNRGNMGYIRANEYPYPFEKAAYETPVGEISAVFEDAPYGYHIVKVTAERPEVGEVSARHILKLTQGLTPEGAAKKKAEIDSIAALLKNGADFETLAKTESEDSGSAQRGGNLGFFGRGVMVPEFEAAAYSLRPGDISEPFATSYGYHIVQTLEYKPLPTLEESRKNIVAMMSRDSRSLMPQRTYLRNLRAEKGIVVSEDAMNEARAIADVASDDNAAIEALKGCSAVLMSLPGNDVKVSDVALEIEKRKVSNTRLNFDELAGIVIDDATLNYARTLLLESNDDFRNLVNEYRDGILLFEISNRKVWDRSSTDIEAQNAFFKANKDNYKWDVPHFKGYVVFAENDSVASEAKGFLANNVVEADSLSNVLNERFGRDVKVQRVLSGKGDNAIIDNIAFGGEKPAPVGRWESWFPYMHNVIDSPEEASDVKSMLSADLQQQLEAEWIKELRSKYKVKINKKAIKKLSNK